MLDYRHMKLPDYYGFFGFVLIIASFFYWYFPFTNAILIVFNSMFYLGNILFFDFLSYELSGFSFLHSHEGKKKLMAHFLLLGLLAGFTLELYVHWFGKFWYYPHWDFLFYILILIPGFGIYYFYLLETYMGVKAVLLHFFVKHKRKKESFAGLKQIFMWFGLVGALGIGGLTVYMILRTTFGNNLQEFLAITNTPFPTNIPYASLVLFSIFFWMFFEYLEYERHETSMLYEIIKGNFLPIIAVFLSAWISAILYEGFNNPGGLWRYANFPLSTVALFNVPIVAFITWPFHYFPLFSLYRVLYKKETQKIWD